MGYISFFCGIYQFFLWYTVLVVGVATLAHTKGSKKVARMIGITLRKQVKKAFKCNFDVLENHALAVSNFIFKTHPIFSPKLIVFLCNDLNLC